MAKTDNLKYISNVIRLDRWEPTAKEIETCGGRLLVARQAYETWRSQFVEGPPKATATDSVEDLIGWWASTSA
jgi:hypothetical protein